MKIFLVAANTNNIISQILEDDERIESIKYFNTVSELFDEIKSLKEKFDMIMIFDQGINCSDRTLIRELKKLISIKKKDSISIDIITKILNRKNNLELAFNRNELIKIYFMRGIGGFVTKNSTRNNDSHWWIIFFHITNLNWRSMCSE